MALDRNKIISSSPSKILRREYENLKNDFSKMGAIKYKSFYESESMSFILDNSRYIFSEPLRGFGFYKSFIESNLIPIHRIEKELSKFNEFVESYRLEMSENQLNTYLEMSDVLNGLYESKKNACAIQTAMYEHTEYADALYDIMYEYKRDEKFNEFTDEFLSVFIECNEHVNIIDFLNIVFEHTELQNSIYPYLNDIYHEDANNIELCKSNMLSSFIIENALKDKYFEEGFKSLSNMNAKDIIYNITESCDISFLTDDNISYVETKNLMSISSVMTSMYESTNEIYEETYAEEKYERLVLEKEVIDFASDLLSVAYLESDDNSSLHPVLEYVSTITGKQSDDTLTQIEYLIEFSNSIDNEIQYMTEKYFSNTGAPGNVIASSLGYEKNTDVDDDFIKSKDKMKLDEDEPDDESGKKKSFTEAVDKKDEKPTGHKYTEIRKPEKKSLAKRIANKALDTDVQYKKKVAEGKRGAVDIKNAVKAIAKIPANILNAVKNQLSQWDEMDDNRRKHYILQPGFRKKYYKAFRLCLMHGIAFAVNPVFNIILAFGTYLSKEKDIRIKNEFIRELNAEIKIMTEKIEDAKSKGDDKKKYQMMRYKEKLEAEHVRVMANSKYV